MTDIVIPIKPLAEAKQRLAGFLGPALRAMLVLAMLEDLLAALAGLENDRLLLVASDDEVFDLGMTYGAEPLRERHAQGYNEAVAAAFETLGVGSAIAVLPGDLPLAAPAEIAMLIAPVATDARSVRLAPARDGRGTNGLFLSAPGLIRPSFGPESFARYQQTARVVGIAPEVLRAPTLAHDIDTLDDLQDFARIAASGTTRDFLGKHGICLNATSNDRGAA